MKLSHKSKLALVLMMLTGTAFADNANHWWERFDSNSSGQVIVKDAGGASVTAKTNPTGANSKASLNSATQPAITTRIRLGTGELGGACATPKDDVAINAARTLFLVCAGPGGAQSWTRTAVRLTGDTMSGTLSVHANTWGVIARDAGGNDNAAAQNATGSLYVNDAYFRSTGKWASQMSAGGFNSGQVGTWCGKNTYCNRASGYAICIDPVFVVASNRDNQTRGPGDNRTGAYNVTWGDWNVRSAFPGQPAPPYTYGFHVSTSGRNGFSYNVACDSVMWLN